MKEQEFCILAFYQFKTTTNKLQLQEKLNNLSKREKIKGIVLIADEGINGTVSGFIDGIKKLEKYLEKEGFTTLEKKYAYSSYMPFHRMKVKLKKEIITFAGEEVNVEKQTGEFVSPEDWNKLIEDPEVTLLDIRNLYKDTGLFTYDPGFTSTASCQSKITFIDGENGILRHRGFDIEELTLASIPVATILTLTDPSNLSSQVVP